MPGLWFPKWAAWLDVHPKKDANLHFVRRWLLRFTKQVLPRHHSLVREVACSDLALAALARRVRTTVLQLGGEAGCVASDRSQHRLLHLAITNSAGMIALLAKVDVEPCEEEAVKLVAGFAGGEDFAEDCVRGGLWNKGSLLKYVLQAEAEPEGEQDSKDFLKKKLKEDMLPVEALNNMLSVATLSRLRYDAEHIKRALAVKKKLTKRKKHY